MKNESIQV